jgi:hypothetical protein
MANKQAKKKIPEPAGPEALMVTTAVYTQLSNNTERPIEVVQEFPKEMGRKAETHRVEATSIELVDHVTGATFKAHFAD